MKKLNLLKPLFLFALLGLCSTACKDDDGQIPMPEPEGPGCRLVMIGYGSYSTVIEYNAQGYVTQLTDKNPDGTYSNEYTFTYNSDNLAIRKDWYDRELEFANFYATFEYNNGLPTTMKLHEPDDQVYGISSFKYDSKKRLIEETSSDCPYGVGCTYTYTYDSRDNLIKKETFSEGKIVFWETYENYDNNPTPYSALKGLPAFYYQNYSKNNPGKKVRMADENQDGIIQSDETTEARTYTYTYSSNGYPTKIAETGGKHPHTDTFDYACK